MKVSIEPYDPQWALKFLEIQSRLQQILHGVPIISIEHVGSTSIPGLRAKTVIDIDIVITQTSLEAADAALTSAGYTSLGEMDVPGRFVFREPGFGKYGPAHGRGEDGEVRQNTYVCIEGCASLRNHLDIRKILLNDQDLREEYSNLKASIQDTEFDDIHQYVARKMVVLCKILRAAGWSDEELKPVIDINT